jgi:transcription antitermination protein NusB
MTQTSKERRQNAEKLTARLAAVQALYEMDMGPAKIEAILRDFLKRPLVLDADEGPALPKADADLFDALVRAATARRDEIDGMLTSCLSGNWSLDRIDSPMKYILRAGCAELLACPENPAAAIINDYVDIAHSFFAGREPGMINAILDKLSKTLRG